MLRLMQIVGEREGSCPYPHPTPTFPHPRVRAGGQEEVSEQFPPLCAAAGLLGQSDSRSGHWAHSAEL